MAEVETWLAEVAGALDIPLAEVLPGTLRSELLDLTGDIAHNVVRVAVPLTSYLMGSRSAAARRLRTRCASSATWCRRPTTRAKSPLAAGAPVRYLPAMPAAAVNGIEISYTDSGGEGPAVVFSHGFLAVSQALLRFLRGLDGG
jgi:uncharacterized protein DUF6457